MPVRLEEGKAKRLAKDDPLTMEWINDMFHAAGMLTPEELHARIAELVMLDRKHTPDERREFKRLVKRWHRDNARRLRHQRRSDKARAQWAAFTPGERAEWDRRSLEQHRQYDRTLSRPVLSGEDWHHLYVTVIARDERREAKAKARRADKRAARAAAAPEPVEVEVEVGTPVAEVAAAPELVAMPELIAPAMPRRRRRRPGIVRQYDAFGRLVYDADDDDEDD